MIKLGEWLPDQPAIENPGLTECLNCVPAVGCYKPFPSAVVYGTAIDSKPKGVWSGLDDSASVRMYVGTKTKLYDVTGTTPYDLSPITYNAPDDGGWEFIKFAGRIIATNGQDPVQAMEIGDNLMADLSPDAPKARHICAAKNFVVLANIYDSIDGNKTQRIHWSAIGVADDWPTPGSTEAAQKQSSYQDLNDNTGGWINAIIGGDSLTIFLQRGIYRAQYVGGNIVWQFDIVDSDRGLVADKAIVKTGGLIFFLDRDGFYAFDGVNSIPIGDGKVDQYFWDTLNHDYLFLTSATCDPNNKLVIFSYVSSASNATMPDTQLIYNWQLQRWSRVNVSDHLMFINLTRGYTLDTLDEVSTDIDSFTESFDSRNWTASNAVISGFNSSLQMVDYTGPSLSAKIESQEIEVHSGRRSVITGIRPIINGAPTVTVKVGVRSLQSQSPFYSSASTVNPRTGWHDMRIEGRFQRVQINTVGNFEKIVGFDINASKGGYV